MKTKCLAVFAFFLLLPFLFPAAGRAAECPSEAAETENGGKHRFVLTDTQAPACTESGSKTYVCEYCGTKRTESLPALGHDYGSWNIETKRTCLQREKQVHTCNRCGKVEWTFGSYGSHVWGDWTVISAPTDSETGLRERVCQLCGAHQQEELAAGETVPDQIEAAGEEIKQAFLLQAVPRFPKESYALDMIGMTEYIPYLLTVTNLGDTDCSFSSFSVTVGGSEQTYDVQPQTLAPGASFSFPFSMRFTRQDILPDTADETSLGYVEIVFSASAATGEEENAAVVSNAASFRHRIAAGDASLSASSEQDYFSFQVQITCTADEASAPWMEGEEIPCRIEVKNLSNETIASLTLRKWPGETDEQPVYIDELHDIQPGESRTVGYTYRVRHEDAVRGFASMVAAASWVDLGSGAVSIACAQPWIAPALLRAEEDEEESALSVAVHEINAPQNGAYYTPGEAIRFSVEVTNETGGPLYGVTVRDALTGGMDGNPLAVWDSLEPGETGTVDAFYGVTALDGFTGGIFETVMAAAADSAGNTVMAAVSEKAAVATERESEEVTVWQNLLSAPTNGVAYQYGETLSYEITLFVAGEDISQLTVCSSLEPTCSGQIAQIEATKKGEFTSIVYQHAVTAEEAVAGLIDSRVFVTYVRGGQPGGYAEAEAPIVSKTGAGIVQETAEGVPARLALPLTDETDSCSLTLTVKGDNAAEYIRHSCARHAAVAQMATAQDDTEEAWRYALALWLDEADALYQQYAEAAYGSARLAILKDRVAFLQYVSSYEALLKQLNPGQSAYAARKTAEMVADQCAELCWGLHHAGEQRADSVISGSYARMVNTGTADACARMNLMSQSGDKQYRDTLCGVHGSVEEAVSELLNHFDGKDGGVWENIYSLWNTALLREVNAYSLRGSEEAQAAGQYVAAVNGFLAARKNMLDLLYPDNGWIAGETLCGTMMDQAVDFCRESNR